MNGFVRPDAPLLSAVVPAVSQSDIGSVEVQTYIANMHKVVYGNQIDRSRPIMVGVAAPQIGVARRIILVDVAAEGHGQIGDLRTYINPEIVWESPETSDWYEGCYSTDRVCGIVSRPLRVRVHALDQMGTSVDEMHSGYTARIFQHEVDHLNGIVFVERIESDSNLHWVEREKMRDYRNNEGWRHWPDPCSRERWLEIKGQQA